MRTFAIFTLGCKINQYESAAILSSFYDIAYAQVKFPLPADVYIINTCTVTARTDYKSRNAIRKALAEKATNPQVKIIVTGCYSQNNYVEAASLGDIDLLVDNNCKNQIIDYITDLSVPEFRAIDIYQEFSEMTASSMGDKTRAFLKIQDGCNFYCAYCTIPAARGVPRSRALPSIIAQAELFVSKGYREIVIGGINLGLYGIDTNANLADVLRQLLKLPDLKLIRLSSIEPQLLSDEIIQLMVDNTRICPHLHIPLQAGTDELLKKMNRHYDTGEYQQLIEKLIKRIPHLAIGADIITGLPGETDADFEQTCEFLKSLPLAYFHVFPYSPRAGTKAAGMSNQLTHKIKASRSKLLHSTSLDNKLAYLQKLIENKTALAGIIEKREAVHYTALSDHYIRVYCVEANLTIGKYYQFIPQEIHLDGLICVIQK